MAQQHKQQQRRRTRSRGGVALLVVAAASAAFLLFSVVEAAAEGSTSAASASASASAPTSLSSSLGPVFIAEEASDLDDHRVEVSEEELILETGALESLMQVSSGEEGSDDEKEANGVNADARLQAAVEGAQAAAAAAAPVCSSVESCLALCPTESFLVAGGATEGSVEESVRVFFGRERNETENCSREQLSFLASNASLCRWAKGFFRVRNGDAEDWLPLESS